MPLPFGLGGGLKTVRVILAAARRSDPVGHHRGELIACRSDWRQVSPGRVAENPASWNHQVGGLALCRQPSESSELILGCRRANEAIGKVTCRSADADTAERWWSICRPCLWCDSFLLELPTLLRGASIGR